MNEIDPVLLAKAETIARCVERVSQVYDASAEFSSDHDAQDIAVINLIRACEAAIDMAMRVIRLRSLTLPATSGDAFAILAQANIIGTAQASRLRAMCGFRNVAVHDYTRLDLSIFVSIIRSDLNDVMAFVRDLLAT
jgi:uncharacterized protein YutE (UPF0331/DUF86 family)